MRPRLQKLRKSGQPEILNILAAIVTWVWLTCVRGQLPEAELALQTGAQGPKRNDLELMYYPGARALLQQDKFVQAEEKFSGYSHLGFESRPCPVRPSPSPFFNQGRVADAIVENP